MAPEWPLTGAPRAAVCILVVTGFSLVAALANGLPVVVRGSLAAAALIVGIVAVTRACRPPNAGLHVEQGVLRLHATDGETRSGRITSAFVSPLFVGLRWRPDDGRFPSTLGIFREQMRANDFRRLSAALRSREPA